MTDARLKQAVMAYKAKRAEIKAKQRIEIDDLSEPWAADVGDEIIRIRETEHKSISDIAAIIGIENRTFIYNMINASKRRSGKVDHPVLEYAENGGVWATSEDTAPYSLTFEDGTAVVSFPAEPGYDPESYEVVVIDGTPDLPEVWAEHSKDRRLLYKEIIDAIRKHDWS